MRFTVVAPVAAGVTADPGWMADFARHVEACGFESLIALGHAAARIDQERAGKLQNQGAHRDAGWRIAHRALAIDAIETRPVRRLRE